MDNVINKLFTIMVGGKKELVVCEGAYISALGQLYLKVKMQNGSHMNVYICGLYDETIQEV